MRYAGTRSGITFVATRRQVGLLASARNAEATKFASGMLDELRKMVEVEDPDSYTDDELKEIILNISRKRHIHDLSPAAEKLYRSASAAADVLLDVRYFSFVADYVVPDVGTLNAYEELLYLDLEEYKRLRSPYKPRALDEDFLPARSLMDVATLLRT